MKISPESVDGTDLPNVIKDRKWGSCDDDDLRTYRLADGFAEGAKGGGIAVSVGRMHVSGRKSRPARNDRSGHQRRLYNN